MRTPQGETIVNRSTTTDNYARLNIKTNSFSNSGFSSKFFDVQGFNPPANRCPRSIPDSKNYHKFIKKLKYEQKLIKVKKASFCPLIFSGTGGVGSSESEAIRRMASRISDKKENSNLDVMTDIRTKTNFALLPSFCLLFCNIKSPSRS